MRDLPLADHIRTLNEAGALQLAHRLLNAERSRLALPAETVEFPMRVKAPDGGIDGFTSLPADAGTSFPRGRRVWQVKSGKTVPKVEREFALTKSNELKPVAKALAGGDQGYVLFWTWDPVGPVAVAIRDGFSAKVRELHATAEASFLFLSQIVDLVWGYPGIALSVMGSTAAESSRHKSGSDSLRGSSLQTRPEGRP